MTNKFEQIVFDKIVENSTILYNELESKIGKISKTGLITTLSFSASITLDLIFQNKNYNNFDIDLLFELIVEQINKNKTLDYKPFKDSLFVDSFFENEMNTSLSYFNDLNYHKDFLSKDIDSFTQENLISKMNTLAGIQNPEKKVNPIFNYNSFISFYIFPLINTIENSKEKFDKIKNKLNSNPFFIENKNHYTTVIGNIQSTMIRNHSKIDFITAVKEFKGQRIAEEKKTSKNCYIATLVYNDIEHPNVEYLRKYRDKKLSKNFLGKIFIKFYYEFSPKLVTILKPHKRIQKLIRLFLDKLILPFIK